LESGGRQKERMTEASLKKDGFKGNRKNAAKHGMRLRSWREIEADGSVA
jgi:hypothetical protein